MSPPRKRLRRTNSNKQLAKKVKTSRIGRAISEPPFSCLYDYNYGNPDTYMDDSFTTQPILSDNNADNGTQLVNHIGTQPATDNNLNQDGGAPDIDEEWARHCEMNIKKRQTNKSGAIVRVRAQELTFVGLDKIGAPIDVILPALFDKFIEETMQKEGMDPDATRFCVAIHHKSFTNTTPLFIQFRTRDVLDGVAIFNLIGKFQQSNAALTIDDGLTLELHLYNKNAERYVDALSGAGRITHYFDEAMGIPGVVANTDTLCLARAVVYAKLKADEAAASPDALPDIKKQLRNIRKEPRWKNDAELLLTTCDIETDKESYNRADLEKMAEHLTDYKFTLYARPPGQRLYSIAATFNDTALKRINIAHFDGHFDFFKPTRNSIGVFICDLCFESYTRPEQHRCSKKCKQCKKPGCSGKELIRRCDGCKTIFQTAECFANHLLPHTGSFTACDLYKTCLKCMGYYAVRNVARDGHVCFKNSYCVHCKTYVNRSVHHNCCWSVPTAKQKQKKLKKQETFKIILYDFETVVVEDPDEIDNYNEYQWPNMVVFEKIRNKCYEAPPDRPCTTCGVKKDCIKYQSPNDDKWSVVDRFLDYLLTDPKCNNAILMAHNGSRFDAHFFVKRLVARNIYPNCIPNGLQLIQMKVDPLSNQKFNHLIFKDTILLIPLPLASLPEAFGFPSLVKGEFPYLFNKPCNYGKKLPTLPDIEYYMADSKNVKNRAKFDKWYEENKNKEFDFDKELQVYCEMDVRILRNAVAAYITTSLRISDWNPVVHCCTYASYSMFQLKMDYMKPNQVGIIPENGFFNNEHQSDLALCYIQWLEKSLDIELKYKLRGGEYQITHGSRKFRVDAFHGPTNTVYEILGCFYHGCNKCNSPNANHPLSKKSMGQIYSETTARLDMIRSKGYTVVEIWEHTINNVLLKKDKEMAAFFKKCFYKSRLQPRNAFMGGRTQPYRLLNRTTPEKSIAYDDFVSLYPYITSMVAEYPVGFPHVLTGDFLPFVDGEDCPYRGLVLCDVLPPSDIRYPVIGAKMNDKLIFSNCRTCAELGSNNPCTHYTVEERFFHITICHVELSYAMKRGYKVLKCYEVWEWDEWEKGGLFKGFTEKYIKIKQEASGWPRPAMTDEEKERFIREHEEKVGVKLDSNNIEYNGPLRTVAKLALNSVWGKSGQHPGKTTIQLMPADDERVYTLINSESIDMRSFSLIDDSVQVSHKPRREYQQSAECTNVAIAAYTTAYARLRLLSAMEKIGEDLIYVDTDSLVYFTDESKPDRLADMRGGWLGSLVSELPPGFRMTKFVSIAPKVYTYELENDAGEKQIVCKVKGVTLDSDAVRKINYQVMEDMVRALVEEEEIPVVKTGRAMITKQLGEIQTRFVTKKLQPVMNKLRYLPDYTTQPYGTLQPQDAPHIPTTIDSLSVFSVNV